MTVPVVKQSHRVALAHALVHARYEVIPISRGRVEAQAAELPAGATVTITSSPSRGVENTLAYAETLAPWGFRIVPHIAARSVRDEAQLRTFLRRVEALGLREVFVVGGDSHTPAGSFTRGIDLLRAMAYIGHTLEAIGVPSYPERHPLIDEATLRRDLIEKQELATYTVSQICFDPSRLADWLRGLRGDGVGLPIFIGVPGAVDRTRLLGMAMKIGVGESLRFLSRNTRFTTRALGPGTFRPDDLVLRLAPLMADPAYGVAGLHLNTFNQVVATRRWVEAMLQRLGGDAGEPHGGRAG